MKGILCPNITGIQWKAEDFMICNLLDYGTPTDFFSGDQKKNLKREIQLTV